MERLTQFDFSHLEQICPGGVHRDVDLSTLSQWRIGGNADLILRPASGEQVAALRNWFFERGMSHVVIGLTSNILFADEGLRVPCIQIDPRMGQISISGAEVYAQAGAWVPGLARRLMQAGLSGAEHICGIPGTLGGLICMNGGSQRKGIGSSVLKIHSVDARGLKVQRLREDCGFAYRHSIFQSNGEVITSATLTLRSSDRARIRAEMRSILAERRRKFPRKQPNCGSVFKSDPAMYAEIGAPGAAIARLGFKGVRIGDAMVSPHHANFFVNTSRARCTEMLSLIQAVSNAVEMATGYRMQTEVKFMTPRGQIIAADSSRAAVSDSY